MIAQFPPFYPDELLYSAFARYYVRSGHSNLRDCMKDLYPSICRPTVEYSNALNAEVIKILSDIEDVIKKHTMYSNYARFVSASRRRKALRSLVDGTTEYTTQLGIPVNRTGNRHLRYCPLCASKDRSLYGETYWHRSHQVYGVTVCSEHNCYLKESTVWIHSKSSPALTAAEVVIPYDEEIIACQNKIEIDLNHYLVAVFQQPVSLKKSASIDRFLKYRISQTKYISLRGEHIWADQMFRDLMQYYSGYKQDVIKEAYQISKTLQGKKNNPLAICMICMFLDIDPADLSEMKAGKIMLAYDYEQNIIRLHNEGYNYRQISNMLNASYDYTKRIGVHGGNHKQRPINISPKAGPRKRDYTAMDADYYQRVKNAVDLVLSNDGRPEKISVSKIERMVGLPQRCIEKLPKCYSYVRDHIETIEEYWIREIEWSYQNNIHSGIEMNITNVIIHPLNLNRSDINRIIPLLDNNNSIHVRIREMIDM